MSFSLLQKLSKTARQREQTASPAHIQNILSRAELIGKDNGIDSVLAELRKLRLEDFGQVLLDMPDRAWPVLSQQLPTMASEEVQTNWTGTSGIALLQQTLDFVGAVERHFSMLTGRSLKNRKILDFGCGYGRIARLMYYYTSPSNLFCADPWDESIRLCRESRLPGNFFISDYVPRSLPFADKDFDLIYCFSVFTHLSMKTAKITLKTLRNCIADNGLLAITIRPEEYWLEGPVDATSKRSRQELIEEHRRAGFAFVPHNREPIDGDITYGDTTMSIDWLIREFPDWKIAAHNVSRADPNQREVFLKPR